MPDYKYYYPYVSDKSDKKFRILTKNNRWIYFGDKKYKNYTEGHLDEKRRELYVKRHRKNEDWKNKDTPGFWSYHYLWEYPTYEQAYRNIKTYL